MQRFHGRKERWLWKGIGGKKYVLSSMTEWVLHKINIKLIIYGAWCVLYHVTKCVCVCVSLLYCQNSEYEMCDVSYSVWMTHWPWKLYRMDQFCFKIDDDFSVYLQIMLDDRGIHTSSTLFSVRSGATMTGLRTLTGWTDMHYCCTWHSISKSVCVG